MRFKCQGKKGDGGLKALLHGLREALGDKVSDAERSSAVTDVVERQLKHPDSSRVDEGLATLAAQTLVEDGLKERMTAAVALIDAAAERRAGKPS